MLNARLLYNVVVRSTLAYGASAFYRPTDPNGQFRKIAVKLAKQQTECFCVVAGAYKATAAKLLTTETYTPPLNLYFNERVAKTEKKWAAFKIAALINMAIGTVENRLQTRSMPCKKGLYRN